MKRWAHLRKGMVAVRSVMLVFYKDFMWTTEVSGDRTHNWVHLGWITIAWRK